MTTSIEKTIIMEISLYDYRGQEAPQCLSRRTRKASGLIQPDSRCLKTVWSNWFEFHSC